MTKKILYLDMDGVVADFDKKIKELIPNIDQITDSEVRSKMIDGICEANPTIFETLEAIEGAVEAVSLLSKRFEIYFLSTPMWNVPASNMSKRIWLEKTFGEFATKRLILTHRKDLNIGHYLIDDRTKNGAGNFSGELILFRSAKFPNWERVIAYLDGEVASEH